MNQSQNPASILSKNMISDAMILLMNKKAFSAITITEIAKKAEVDRRTFYRNFNSKEDVLDYCYTKLVNEFLDELLIHETFSCLISIRILFELSKRHQDFFYALEKNHMLEHMLEQWNSALPVIHNMILDRITSFPDTKDQDTLSYLLTFNVGGTFNIICKWIKDGMKLSMKELMDIVQKLGEGTLLTKHSGEIL